MQVKSLPTWGCSLSVMLQILIFSFCEESWTVSLAKVMHIGSHPPAAKETSLRRWGGGRGGWVNVLKKEDLWPKPFLFVNAEWSYKILWNIL